MKSKIFNRYWYLLGIVSLASCNVNHKFTRPSMPSDVNYHNAVKADTSQVVTWFKLYQDTVLQRMIQTTLDSNKNMLIAVSRIEEARSRASIARASLYPQLSYQAQAETGKAGINARKVAGGIDGGVINGYGVLNWELDVWGKLRAGKRSVVNAYFSTIANRDALKVSLVAEVASQYFLLRDLDNRLIIAQKTLEGRKAYTKIISEKFDKGYVPELDKLMAIQQEADVAAAIPSLERQITGTENSIRLLMGKGPGKVARGYSNFEQSLSPDIPVGLPAQLLQRRPDVLSAEKSLESQFELIGVAKANRFPTLSLTGILGLASPQLSSLVSNSSTVSTGLAGLTGPLFNFNQLKNQVNIEQKRTAQAYYTYQSTVLGALHDVDNSLEYVRTYTQEYNQRKVQANACARALILSEARYDHGFTSFLEVLVQQDNLLTAQLGESAALQGKLNSIVMLYKSLGGGW
jgi:multidrug efflux system outer membrane protein